MLYLLFIYIHKQNAIGRFIIGTFESIVNNFSFWTFRALENFKIWNYACIYALKYFTIYSFIHCNAKFKMTILQVQFSQSRTNISKISFEI